MQASIAILCASSAPVDVLRRSEIKWREVLPYCSIYVGRDCPVDKVLCQNEVVTRRFDGIGACAVRNRLFQETTEQYIILLDDDSYIDRGNLDDAIAYLNGNPSVGALSFGIFNKRSGRWQTRSDRGRTVVRYFVACGAIVRREAWLAVGGFDERLQFYGEETEIAARFFVMGFRVVAWPEVVVIHDQQAPPGSSRRKLYLQGRNKLLWDFAFSPVRVLLIKASVSLFRMLIYAIATRKVSPLAGALSGIFIGLRRLCSGKTGCRMSLAQMRAWFALPDF